MAAQSGNARFQGRSGRSYNKAIYISDSTGVTVKFDAGAGASANGDPNVQFDEPVVLADVSIAAQTTVTQLQVTRNGVQTGDTLLIANQLAAVNNRVGLAIPVAPGQRLGLIQLT